MNNPTYLFYDIETTGLNKCFDQVLQFAAIRTDLALNEIERTEINVKLNCDVIPAPQAVITHRIGVDAFSSGDSEYDAIKKIHVLLNHPGTISIGYNSLGFDDEFLRFSFYKNLLPPYTHQFSNGCGRMDIYPISILYFLFKKDILKWPKTNLKLENINACNQLFEGRAHNAMIDVEVTVSLAKKLIRDEKMWHFVMDYFQKKADEARINNCESDIHIDGKNYKMGFMINGKIGSTSSYIAPVIDLGQHLHYKNQSVWLRLDDEKLQKTKREKITETTKVLKKRLGEPPIFLPLKDRYLNLLSDDRKNKMIENQKWLSNHPDLFYAIRDYHIQEKYPFIPERDCDAALYEIGFAAPIEEKLFQQFHAAAANEKYAIATQFPNKTRKQQAIRILARHFPDTISAEDKNEFNHYLKSEPVDFRGEKKLTASRALTDIETLLQSNRLDEEQRKLLFELQGFLKE